MMREGKKKICWTHFFSAGLCPSERPQLTFFDHKIIAYVAEACDPVLLVQTPCAASGKVKFHKCTSTPGLIVLFLLPYSVWYNFIQAVQ